MLKLDGVSASPGIVIGEIFLYGVDKLSVEHYQITPQGIPGEIKRFESALEKSKDELRSIQNKIRDEIDTVAADIFNVHELILEDPIFLVSVTEKIHKEKCNVETAVVNVLENFARIMSGLDDSRMSERYSDIIDVAKRLVKNLTADEKKTPLENIHHPVVVVAHDLTPSDTLHLNRDYVCAIVTDIGSRTSHTAIMARAFGIPAVVGLGKVTELAKNDQQIVVDGLTGRVVLKPTDKTIEKYRKKQFEYHRIEISLKRVKYLPSVTRDGIPVELLANIEVPEEVDDAIKNDAKGVGLFRTEYLFIGRRDVPSEEEQYRHYRKVIEMMKPRPVTIRTIDIGGDKYLSSLDTPIEDNPFMGERAIRLCLSRKELFRPQLRAILRAAYYGNASILFPMIGGLNELIEAKKHLENAKNELKKEHKNFDKNIKIGVMIEIPSAVLIADILAKEADYFSIGTNDLIQYTLAVDRVNEKVAHLYQPLHPSVLKLIKMTIASAKLADISVTVCGEMAGDPRMVIPLLGMGLRNFSMSPIVLLEVKKVLRSFSVEETEKIMDGIYKLETADKIDKYIHKHYLKKISTLTGRQLR